MLYYKHVHFSVLIHTYSYMLFHMLIISGVLNALFGRGVHRVHKHDYSIIIESILYVNKSTVYVSVCAC